LIYQLLEVLLLYEILDLY